MNKKILALTLLVVMSFVSIFSFSTLVKATNDIELSGTVVTQSGSLNVKKSPSTSSAVIATLKKGSTVTVIETDIASTNSSSTKWCKIEYGKITGYVSSSYIDITELQNYTTASSLNVRTQPSTTSSKIESLHSYTLVRVLETVNTSSTTNPIWYRIQHNNNIGYVSATYIQLIKMENLRAGKITTSALNLRSNPSTSSKVLDVLSKKRYCFCILYERNF